VTTEPGSPSAWGRKPLPRLAIGSLGLVALLVACGSSDRAVTTSVVDSIPPTEPSLTPASVATDLTAAGFGCRDLEANEDDQDPGSSVPSPDVVSARCTADGREITINVFASADDAQLAHQLADTVWREQLSGSGYTQLAWAVSGPADRVWIQVENDEFTAAPSTADLELLDKIAAALGGKVQTADL